MKSLLSDFRINVQIKILSDSTAAIGMVRRLGLGRVRHLACADLWVQQHLRNGSFVLGKHPGTSNSADLMTKHKSRDELVKLLKIMGFGSLPGRAAVAPLRAKGWNVSQPVSAPTKTTPDLHALGWEMDNETRSHIVHHHRSVCSVVEGRRLTPS